MTDAADETDRASVTKGLAWFALACLLGVAFAVGIAPLARAIPWSWEKNLAERIDLPSAQVCKTDPEARALKQMLVNRLYPLQPYDNRFSIDVQVVHDHAVNAYAGLGGRIYVNSALLEQAQSPEELAGVLAHEIEHVHHRHIMQAVLTRYLTAEGLQIVFSGNTSSTANWAGFFLKLNFSRSQETEADHDGLLRLQKAHIDNAGFQNFFQRMEDSSIADTFLSDHPSDETRIEMVKQFKNTDIKPVMTHEEWLILKKYCR